MGLNAPVGSDDGEVWPPISAPLADSFYPEIRDQLGTVLQLAQAHQKVGDALQSQLRGSSQVLMKPDPIAGSPAECHSLSREFATTAQAIGDLEVNLGRQQNTLQQAWQGGTGTALQQLMSDIAEDAKSVREISMVGASTLEWFTHELELAQGREYYPRAEVLGVAYQLGALQMIDKPAFVAFCETLRRDCDELRLIRQTFRQALLTARASLRSRQPLIERAIIIETKSAADDNSALVYDSDAVRESTKALSQAANTLIGGLMTRPYAVGIAGELSGEVKNFQIDERSGLTYLGERVHQLAEVMHRAGLDLALTDQLSAQQVCTVAGSRPGTIPPAMPPGEAVDPDSPPYKRPAPDANEPESSPRQGPSGAAPNSDGAVSGPVPLKQAPTTAVAPVTGSRRDPDDRTRMADDNLKKVVTSFEIEPDQLRRWAAQHDEAAQTVRAQLPVDLNPDYSNEAPAPARTPQPAPAPMVTAPR